jgi:histidine triad (HIT) family protein
MGIEVRVFAPLFPVCEGHTLIAPVRHVVSAAADPVVAAAAMLAAATEARRWAAVNIITSVGAAATQTVPHLHVHVVPRVAGDQLALPWSTGRYEVRRRRGPAPPSATE